MRKKIIDVDTNRFVVEVDKFFFLIAKSGVIFC